VAASYYFSVLLIKRTFIPICPKDQSLRPGRCPAHLLTNSIYAGVFAALDDQFIMDVAHNGTAPQRLHSVAENVPADALDDVFHELGPVAFQPLPLLGGPDAFVGHGFPTELILPDPGLHIGKSPAAGQFDEQHTALAERSGDC
jgi:hypothetical protein